MYPKAFVLALVASPLVAAHGKVAVVTGDAGGNGTALGIKGGIVPGPGPNRKTEVDTTVFKNTKIQTDGLGRTNGGGRNKVSMLTSTMQQSGQTLPQVSPNGGSISGVFHIVTTDGAGPIQAVLDPTGTGAFSKGVMLQVETQVPGKNGNIAAPKKNNQRSLEYLWERATPAIFKRAANVNQDHAMKFSVPAGTTCSGTINDVQNVCLVKIANSNRAGPFGGVVAIQMVGSGRGGNTTTPAAAAKKKSKGKRATGFTA